MATAACTWVNPLVPNRYCIYILFFIFKVHLTSRDTTDLVNPQIPKAHYSGHWDKPHPLQIKPLKVNLIKVKLADFYFCTLGTNGLTWMMITHAFFATKSSGWQIQIDVKCCQKYKVYTMAQCIYSQCRVARFGLFEAKKWQIWPFLYRLAWTFFRIY